MPPTIAGSPPREKEERWISSSTLLEAPQPAQSTSSSHPPTTPEPGQGGNKPNLFRRGSLSPHPEPFLTPGSSHHVAVAAASVSPGSPLTPLQFIRRAEDIPAGVTGARPISPLAPKGTGVRPTIVAGSSSSSNSGTGRSTPGTHGKRTSLVHKWRL